MILLTEYAPFVMNTYYKKACSTICYVKSFKCLSVFIACNYIRVGRGDLRSLSGGGVGV